MPETLFDYDTAFSRTLGWITEKEQSLLRTKTVAIGGMGGVGGHHLLALTRLGITKFRIADGDVFEMVNFNRQAGAMCSTINQSKVDVMMSMAYDINPDIEIERYEPITEENVISFLAGVDVYVDGIDFFAFTPREILFDYCHRFNIPAITAAPLGMGVAWLTFMPKHMSFEEYFLWKNRTDQEKAIHFFAGLAPAMLHSYLVDRSKIDFAAQKGASTPMGCYLCAGVAATEVLKILLNRGKIWPAPYGQQFDVYKGKQVRTWRPWGNAHPLQKFLIICIKKHFSTK